MQIVYSNLYDKQANEIFSASERDDIEQDIAARPADHPVIPGGRGLRKARAAIGNKGKSGGARIIYYFWQSEDEIFFVSVYAKSSQANLSAAGLQNAAMLVDAIKQDRVDARKREEEGKRKKGEIPYEPSR